MSITKAYRVQMTLADNTTATSYVPARKELDAIVFLWQTTFLPCIDGVIANVNSIVKLNLVEASDEEFNAFVNANRSRANAFRLI